MTDKTLQARLETIQSEREKMLEEEAKLKQELERMQRTESYAFKDKLLSWIEFVRTQDVVVGDFLRNLYIEDRLELESMHGQRQRDGSTYCIDVGRDYYDGLGVGCCHNLVVLEIKPDPEPKAPAEAMYEWVVLRVANKGKYKVKDPEDESSSSSGYRSGRKPMAMEAFVIRGTEPRHPHVHPTGNLRGTFSNKVQIDVSDGDSVVRTLTAWNQVLRKWYSDYPQSVFQQMGTSSQLLQRLCLLIASGPALYARTSLPLDLLYTDKVEEFEDLANYIEDNPSLCMLCWNNLTRLFPGLDNFCMQSLSTWQALTSSLTFRAAMNLYFPYKELRSKPREKGEHFYHGPAAEPSSTGILVFGEPGRCKKKELRDQVDQRVRKTIGQIAKEESELIMQNLYGDKWVKAHAEHMVKKRPAPAPSAKKAPPAKKKKTTK